MTQRYETLTPDDIIRICKEWSDYSTEEDLSWCKGVRFDPEDMEYYCMSEEDLTCEDCLRRWLEEEISPDPVWYSKQFVMEQVAALIEHDESGLSLFHILDEVLADTPEQIRYKSVEAYLEAIHEAMEEKA